MKRFDPNDVLGTFMVNGKPLGDCTHEDLEAWANHHAQQAARHSKFENDARRALLAAKKLNRARGAS